MVTEVQTLPATMTIENAVSLFISPDNLHLAYPVLDEEKRFVGQVTRADALVWRVEPDHGGETLRDRVSDASTSVAYPSNVVGYVVDLMIAEDMGLVAVVEPSTRELRGVITWKDLLAIRRAAGSLETERARFYKRRARARGER